MDAVTILREIWRCRLAVGVAAVVAILVGLALTYTVSLPPKSRKHEVAIASSRILVDTPNSQVVTVEPRGLETLGARASVLANVMTEGEIKTIIAGAAGLHPNELHAGVESEGVLPADLSAAAANPAAYLMTARTATDPDNVPLPIIEIEAQAPDSAAAVRLADAAVAGLQWLSRLEGGQRERPRRASASGHRAWVAAGPPGHPRAEAHGRARRGCLPLPLRVRGHSRPLNAGTRLASLYAGTRLATQAGSGARARGCSVEAHRRCRLSALATHAGSGARERRCTVEAHERCRLTQAALATQAGSGARARGCSVEAHQRCRLTQGAALATQDGSGAGGRGCSVEAHRRCRLTRDGEAEPATSLCSRVAAGMRPVGARPVRVKDRAARGGRERRLPRRAVLHVLGENRPLPADQERGMRRCATSRQ